MRWMRSKDSHARISAAGAAWVVGSAAVVLGVLLLVATGAWAGEYHVYSCRMPDGEVAPTDGWSAAESGSGVVAENKCPTGGALLVGLSDGETHEVEADRGGWVFAAPAGARIASAKLWRAGDADGGWGTNATYEFWFAGPENKDVEGDVIDQCVAEFGCPTGVGNTSSPMSSSNLLTVLPENLDTDLYMNVSCGGSAKFKCPSGKGDSNGYAAVVYLYAADLTLEQTSQPKVSEVEGELATASTLSGTKDLSFHAEDAGSGVYEAVFTVDGSELGSTVLSSNGGHCQNVGQTSDALPAFLYLSPCPASLRADIPFDTTTLTNGTHHLVVSVTNAAGNATVALDRDVDIENDTKGVDQPTTPSPEGQQPQSTEQHAQPIQTSPQVTPFPSLPAVQLANNGSNASAQASLRVRWSATAKTRLTGVYGRAQTASGRLTTPTGAPIGGAVVEVFDTPAYEGAPMRALGTARTGTGGSFSFRVPASTQSARLTFAYSARLDAPTPSVTGSLQLSIPANLSLQISPRTTSRGGRIVFDGRLGGTPLPPGGKQLVLEARTLGTQWRQFQVLSTAPGGSYHATYRFRLAGPIDYQFRAVSQQEADFPYAEGASNVVLVHER
jgi:hypothetical protein